MEGILYKAYVCALQWIYADVGGLSNGKELGACLAMCVEHEAREASLGGKPTQALYWPPYLLLLITSPKETLSPALSLNETQNNVQAFSLTNDTFIMGGMWTLKHQGVRTMCE